jgi:hypothetical protein
LGARLYSRPIIIQSPSKTTFCGDIGRTTVLTANNNTVAVQDNFLRGHWAHENLAGQIARAVVVAKAEGVALKCFVIFARKQARDIRVLERKTLSQVSDASKT